MNASALYHWLKGLLGGTDGQLAAFNADGIPVNATNTDAEVAATVTAVGTYGDIVTHDASEFEGAGVCLPLAGGEVTGDIEITDATKGLILTDTQGTPHRWRLTLDGSGTPGLVWTDLGEA